MKKHGAACFIANLTQGQFIVKQNKPNLLLHKSRQAFILVLVSAFALVMLMLIFGLSSFKSGAVTQLSLNIEQGHMAAAAQAGVNEMLASVKAGVNDRNSTIGRAIKLFYTQNPSMSSSNPHVLYEVNLSPAQLPMSNRIRKELSGTGGEVTGRIRLVASEKVAGPKPSYVGHVELLAQVDYKNLTDSLKVKERRDLKIVNLADPFLDKYALFVKNFCPAINHPTKRVIIEGLRPTPSRSDLFSFVYFGNRFYPANQQYPQGWQGAISPPIRLDIDFNNDKRLLGNLYQPNAQFAMANSNYSGASRGNFFWTSPPIDVSTFADSFSETRDFHQIDELADTYEKLIEAARPGADVQTSITYKIMQDYNRAGGNPANSEIFHSIIRLLKGRWKYFYGYTDYLTLASSKLDAHPFRGIFTYFDLMRQANPISASGGRMPEIFGPGRDIPVYVEGPVYLRFFKVGFLDQEEIPLDIGRETIPIKFPPVPLPFEPAPKTMSGRPISPVIDAINDSLMSKPVIHIPLNYFFFHGSSTAPSTQVKGGIEGNEVFPDFDSSLRTITYIYNSAREFIEENTQTVNGHKTLNLDGNMLILALDGSALDLTAIDRYRGKGRLILAQNNCILGSMAANNADEDSLAIYLKNGNFIIGGNNSDVTIEASLVATCQSGRSAISFSNKNLTITGNLIVDDLNNLADLPENGKLVIRHDAKLRAPENAIRTSVGRSRELSSSSYRGQ